MSDPQNPSHAAEPARSETQSTDAAPTLGRRMFVFKAAAVLTAAVTGVGAAAVMTATPAQAQRCTDRDPYDPRGRGRWCRRRVRRVTDNDPYDPRGRGRGW